MRLCLVGGIYDKPREYRERHQHTPETLLAAALESAGVEVVRSGHRSYRAAHPCDVVHVHHFGRAALQAASQSRTPFVFTGHDLRILNGVQVSPAWRHAYSYVTGMADGLVALSAREYSALEPVRGDIVVRQIPNGIPGTVFRRAECVGSDTKVVLCVGQLEPIKGVDVLLRAAALLAECSIQVRLVYQTSREEPAYRALASALGIADRVQFVGLLSQNDLVREYSTATVLVLPSISESVPSVITEAQLCGTAVIATDVGGVSELLGPHGILIPRNDPLALAGAIRAMLERPPLRSDERDNLRAFALRTASVERMGSAHLQLYDEVIRAGRRRFSLAQHTLAATVRAGAAVVGWQRNLVRRVER